MSRKPVMLLIVVAAALAAALSGQGGAQTGNAGAAIQSAADAGEYALVYFYDGKNAQTRGSEQRFDAAARKFADRSRAVVVDVADPSVKALVTRLGVDRVTMPIIIAMAPNGAVTAGLGAGFTDEQMAGAFVSRGTERCLGALQQGRLVVLCVQGASTKLNDEAMTGVRDFAADARFAGFTDVVTLDPTDKAEAAFLASLQVDPKTPEAVTLLLAPPGGAVARFTGKTDSNEMAQKLQAAMAGATCAPSAGCTPSAACAPGAGCSPKK
jgi:hypothetical protein